MDDLLAFAAASVNTKPPQDAAGPHVNSAEAQEVLTRRLSAAMGGLAHANGSICVTHVFAGLAEESGLIIRLVMTARTGPAPAVRDKRFFLSRLGPRDSLSSTAPLHALKTTYQPANAAMSSWSKPPSVGTTL